MVSDKGGWYYWKCGGRASLNYLLERDMLRHRFPFPVGEDTPQTTLSHPWLGPQEGTIARPRGPQGGPGLYARASAVEGEKGGGKGRGSRGGGLGRQ